MDLPSAAQSELREQGQVMSIDGRLPVQVQVVRPEIYSWALPRQATAGAAAIDIVAAIAEPMQVYPMERVLVPTGLAFAVPDNIAMLLLPRSGLAHNHGLTLSNSVGLIDPDYRGEVMVTLWNTSADLYTINPGDRLCQAMFIAFHPVVLSLVESLPATERGAGGLGHTGVAS